MTSIFDLFIFRILDNLPVAEKRARPQSPSAQTYDPRFLSVSRDRIRRLVFYD